MVIAMVVIDVPVANMGIISGGRSNKLNKNFSSSAYSGNIEHAYSDAYINTIGPDKELVTYKARYQEHQRKHHKFRKV